MWQSMDKLAEQWTQWNSSQSRNHSVPGKEKLWPRWQREPSHFSRLSSTSEYNSGSLDFKKRILWWTLHWRSFWLKRKKKNCHIFYSNTCICAHTDTLGWFLSTLIRTHSVQTGTAEQFFTLISSTKVDLKAKLPFNMLLLAGCSAAVQTCDQ